MEAVPASLEEDAGKLDFVGLVRARFETLRLSAYRFAKLTGMNKGQVYQILTGAPLPEDWRDRWALALGFVPKSPEHRHFIAVCEEASVKNRAKSRSFVERLQTRCGLLESKVDELQDRLGESERLRSELGRKYAEIEKQLVSLQKRLSTVGN